MFLAVAGQYSHRVKDFSTSHAAWPVRRLDWEGTQPGQLIQPDQRDVPCHMISFSAIKARTKKGEGGTSGVMTFIFPRSCYTW